MPGWMKSKAEEEQEEEKEAERQRKLQIVPKEITDKLAKVDTLETSINEVKEKTKVLDRMTSFLDEQDALKAAARKKQADELAAKATETTDDLWLTDPQKASELAMQPVKIATINLASQNLRREIFDDGVNYEYYTGEFKKRVDGWIDKLPVEARADAKSIKNCYNLVLGESMQEIREGKLKSRFAATTTSNTKDGTNNTNNDGLPALTDDQKHAAKMFGLKEEDYAKQMKELNYV